MSGCVLVFQPFTTGELYYILSQGSLYKTVEILTNLIAQKLAIQKTSSEQEVEKETFDISVVLS